MIRRFFLLIVFTALFLTHHSCHERTHEESAHWWDSIQKAKDDSIAWIPLKNELQALLQQRCIDSTTTGYIFIDDSDDVPVVIAQHNPTKMLIPASVQKLLVTGAALEILGEKARKEINTTNLQSHNGLANKLLKDIGKAVTGSRSYTSGARAVIDFWEARGVDLTGVPLYDGSGRRYDNRMNARQLIDILYYETSSPVFGTFYASLPLSGISGTLKKTLKGTIGEGRVRAKTGTLASVKSLAGYASTISGRKIIFVLLINHYTCRNTQLKKMMEKVLIEMVKL